MNSCNEGRYRIHKTIITDPRQPCLIQRVRFEPLAAAPADFRLFVLLSPHLANQGYGNDARIGEYKGVTDALRPAGDTALAMACSTPWGEAGCSFVGSGDGWQDLHAHKRLTSQFSEARGGNVVLTGEIDLAGSGGDCILALGFGRNEAEAGQRARASILEPFDELLNEYVAGWKDYQDRCRISPCPAPAARRTSTVSAPQY